MRLLFISSAFPRPGDPLRAPYNELLCRALARDHDVDVISPLGWRERVTSRRVRAASPTPFSLTYPTYFYVPGILRALHAPCMDRSIRSAVSGVLDRRCGVPDAVISYWAYPDGAAAARVARRTGVPFVMIAGGSDVLMLAQRASHQPLIVSALRDASAVVAVSESIASRVVALGIPPDRVHVVVRGVDEAVFRPRSMTEARVRLGIRSPLPIVLYAGRLAHVKGVDVLMAAARALRGRGVDHHLVVAGDGPLRRRVLRFAATQPSGRVCVPGTVTQEQLAWWYAAAEVVAIPSRSEGVPNVYYEAAACGVPIVASRVGGIAGVARGGIDRLVEPCDPDALADAIEQSLRCAPPRRPQPVRTWAESARDLASVIRTLPQR
jgi:glycosyltransferase involved in cell wall biosynthesis